MAKGGRAKTSTSAEVRKGNRRSASRSANGPAGAAGDTVRPVSGEVSAPTTARGQRTRVALVAAAREVFEDVGYNNCRVADITARANTSYGSFYFYFNSKEDIFRAVVTQLTSDMFRASRVAPKASRDPRARIEAANRAYLQVYRQNARLLAVLEEMSPHEDYFRNLMLDIRRIFVRRNENGIRRLQQQGLADPDIDPAIAASALGGMLERFAHVWLLLGDQYDEEDAVATLTQLWAGGIGLKQK